MSTRKVKIFSSKNSKDLTEKICKYYDGDPINIMKLQRFSDNEFITSIQESVRGCEVYVVSSLIAPSDNIWEVLMIADALKRASAAKVIGVFGYLGYSRQDRKVAAREPIGAKLLANVIQAAGFDRIITIDLHADQLQGFYDIPVDHLSANYIFTPYIKSLNLDNILFASPDVGGTKRCKKFSDTFNTDMVIVHKHRPNPNEVGEMKLIGDVTGKDVFLIDDIVDTAGTLCKAANLMIANGAKSVRAVVTHAILSGDAVKNITESALTEVIITDTIPFKGSCDKLTILSVSEMLSDAIKTINLNDSISNKFSIK